MSGRCNGAALVPARLIRTVTTARTAAGSPLQMKLPRENDEAIFPVKIRALAQLTGRRFFLHAATFLLIGAFCKAPFTEVI